MLNAENFAKMRDGVIVVNCARGELVVEADMKTAIESGKVAGFAVDVFPHEPPKEYGLFGMEQVIATPHLSAATTEAQEKVALQIAEQMSDYLNAGAVVNALNMPSVTAEDARLAIHDAGWADRRTGRSGDRVGYFHGYHRV